MKKKHFLEFQHHVKELVELIRFNVSSPKIEKKEKQELIFINKSFVQVSWRKDGRPIKAGGRITIQHKSDGECSLRISKVTREDQGDYICEATNKFGKLITEARLTVKS